MKPISLRLRGFKGLRAGVGLEEIFIDFTTLPEGLTAICGANGMGKTTLMDNMHPFRLMPYKLRKAKTWSPAAFSYYDHCYGSDAVKEFIFEMGEKRYKSLLLIDADRRKQEAYLYIEEGEHWKPLNDGKTNTYDTAIEEVMGSPTLFFTSVFRAQGAKNLSEYSRGDIMGMISELLNIDHIKEQGDKARKVAEALKAAADIELNKLTALNAEISEVPAIERSILETESVIEAETISVTAAKEDLETSTRSISDLEKKQAVQESEKARLKELETAQDQDKAEIESIDAEVNAKTVKAMNDRQDITTAHTKEQDGIRMERGSQVQERDALESAFNTSKADIDSRIERASKIASRSEEIRAKVGEENDANTKLETLKQDLLKKETEKQGLEAQNSQLSDIRLAIAKKEAEYTNATALNDKARIDSLNTEISAIEVEKQGFEAKRSKSIEIRQTISKKETELSNAKASHEKEKQRIETAIQQAEKTASMLGGVDCRGDGSVNEGCRFIADAVAAKRNLPVLQAELSALPQASPEMARLQSEIEALQKEENSIGDMRKLIDGCQGRITLIRDKMEFDSDPSPEMLEIQSSINSLREGANGLQDIPEKLKACILEIEDIKRNIAGTETALIELAKWTKLIPELDQAEINIVQWRHDLVVKLEEYVAAVSRINEKIKALDDKLEQRSSELKVKLEAVDSQWISETEGLKAKKESIERRRTEREGNISRLKELTGTDFQQEIQKANTDMAAIKARISDIETRIITLQTQLGGYRNKLESLATKNVEAAGIKEKIDRFNQEISYWVILASACSNGGIVALEVDDAGPGIATLTNDLLAACYGPRFAVRLETQSMKKDGGVKEDFDITVFDSETDEVKSITELSGGQITWIEDAITRAICLYNIHRSDKSFGTLFSDEKDGALDDGRKTEFFTVKRRAMEIGHHTREFFISQAPGLVEMADARILLEKGQVTVQ